VLIPFMAFAGLNILAFTIFTLTMAPFLAVTFLGFCWVWHFEVF